ncbi:hypothetical protein [Algoriphagus boritolerans]
MPLVVPGVDQLELGAKEEVIELLIIEETKGKVDPGFILYVLVVCRK